MFLEDRVGSLEAGKLADFVVLDRDLLTCPEDAIKDTHCLRTYVGGKLVYERPQSGRPDQAVPGLAAGVGRGAGAGGGGLGGRPEREDGGGAVAVHGGQS